MANLPTDRLPPLHERIEQQRHTIEALHQEGHRCPDAERQLTQMLKKLRGDENGERASAR